MLGGVCYCFCKDVNVALCMNLENLCGFYIVFRYPGNIFIAVWLFVLPAKLGNVYVGTVTLGRQRSPLELDCPNTGQTNFTLT